MVTPVPLVALLSLHLALSLASFTERDMRGMYIFQFGAGTCPTRLTISANSLTVRAEDISVNDSRCSAGSLRAARNPSSSTAGLVRYLRGTREAGDIVAVFVEADLECPARTLGADSRMVFAATEADLTVSWARVFENNGTFLATNSPTADAFVFRKGRQHMVIDNVCMYNRIDIPNPPGRRCFPARATARTRGGAAVRMDALRAGEEVLAGGGRYSRVVGFTHRSGDEWTQMVRIGTEAGAVTASPGHYVYAEGGLRRAGDVRRGMTVRAADGQPRVVRWVQHGVRERGLYNPQTESGDIVVDGVLCSCYTEAVRPVLAHALLAPVRLAGNWGVDLLSVVSAS